jgi:TonB-linked SusC/RagA family outer membrane protein
MKKGRLLLLTGLLLFANFLYAQNRTVSGTVLDNEGRPLAQVSVVVTGTTLGTVTDVQGAFTLQVPSTAKTLDVSYVGFKSQTVAIPAQGNITVALAPGSNLDEVVVTGYTREKRSSFTGAVSKVESKEINQIPMASIDQVLQGRSPGLYVTAGSGQPGAAATVIIRGVGSINGGTAPLYVIDGIPVSAGVFSALSTSDIESVDVLRDASATALYGSRGSNGVIVITTKRGRPGSRVVFGAKAQYGVANRTREKFEMMNSAERLQFEEEIGVESGLTIGPGWTYSPKNLTKVLANGQRVPKTQADITRGNQVIDSLRGMDVDWRDILFRDGDFQEYEVNAQGGSDRISFYSAFNYFKQRGIALRSDLQRYSLRNNVDIRASRFTASISTTLNFAHTNFIESENTTAVTNPFASVYYALPYEEPYINGVLAFPGNAKGNTTAFNGIFDFTPAAGKTYYVLDQREGTSALERVLATTQKRDEIKAVLGGNFRFKITDNFALISTLGLDYREFLAERYIDPNTQTGTLVTGARGSFSEGANRFYRLFSNGGVNFTKRFGANHNVDVTALYESISTRARNFNYVGFGINPLLLNTPAGITQGTATNGFIPTVGGARDLTGLQSFIAIGRYSFKDKLSFNGSYRVDGSSTVPESNRWHPFFSVGGTWNISRENFMEGVGFISDLKLRASYGETASPFVNSFDYLSTYGNARYDGITGIAPVQFGNEFYDWEYNKQTNIGVDFALLNRRIRASVDLYNKNTENLFINQQVSRTSGTGALNINAGTMRNRGVELDLNTDVVAGSDLRWTVGGNISYNENEITDLGQVNEFILGTSIVRVGLPYGQHYIPRWGGVDAATGNPLYYNKDGSVTTTYNRAEQSVAEFGTFLPKVMGGFNSSLNFKGLYLEAFFSFASGNKRFNNEDFFNENSTFALSNQSTLWFERWRKPGDVTNIQRFGTPRQFSSKDIQDASYLRLRNVNLGYMVPAKVLQKLTGRISAATIYVQGQNIYTWTNWRGFDPEDNNNISTFEYPGNRVITFGINLNF